MKQPGDFFGELMKTLRREWRTVAQLREELRCNDKTARNWLDQLHAQGLVDSKLADHDPKQPGVTPSMYAVTKAWGGCAPGVA